MFTARYGLNPYIKQTLFVFKGLMVNSAVDVLLFWDVGCWEHGLSVRRISFSDDEEEYYYYYW
jgi:hypothetical protein